MQASAFEGAFTPSLSVLPDERIMDIFQAELWDLGLLGWLFGYKKRLVLTNRRLIPFEKRIIDNALEIIWLPRVKSVVAGQELHATRVAVGLMIIVMSFTLAGSCWRLLGPIPSISVGLLMCALGLLVIFLARRKVMLVSTGEERTGLRLTRIKSEESKRFADKVFATLAAAERVPADDAA